MRDEDLLARILRSARFARKEGYGVLSTGEQLAAALALNRADWLAEMDYTIGQALERLPADWITTIPDASRILRDDALKEVTP